MVALTVIHVLLLVCEVSMPTGSEGARVTEILVWRTWEGVVTVSAG